MISLPDDLLGPLPDVARGILCIYCLFFTDWGTAVGEIEAPKLTVCPFNHTLPGCHMKCHKEHVDGEEPYITICNGKY